jgi:hypothetical protein
MNSSFRGLGPSNESLSMNGTLKKVMGRLSNLGPWSGEDVQGHGEARMKGRQGVFVFIWIFAV